MAIITIEHACQERKKSRHEAAVSYFSNKVVALYKDKRERSLPNIRHQEFASAGSGVLISISNRRFLVTAAHVLRSAKLSPLWFMNNGLFESFGGAWRVTGKPGGEIGSDPEDYGWIELDDDLTKKMCSSRFVPEERIMWSMSREERRGYTIIGYPHSKNKKFYKNIRVGTWAYTSESVSAEAQTLETYKNHLFISYDPKSITDSEGKIVPNSVYPQGASGGAFVDLGDFRDPTTLTEEMAPTPKLAGIFIEYHKEKRMLVGMNIKNIIDDIKRECAL